MEFTIAPMGPEDVVLFDEHFRRHRAESGRGDYHFMPFEPDDPDGPQGIDLESLARPLDQIGWQRWWLAREAGDGRAVGHIDVKGERIKTALHRCELGIGIERPYRGAGLGRRLMQAAIDFSRAAPSLDWLDLRVFAHNANARALYRALGFEEVGMVPDRVRVEGERIDDVLMTLNVSQAVPDHPD